MNDSEPIRSAKVTIRTVAEDAGVSVAAVSKVLRNAYGVSDALRARVLGSIEKLGYRPSTAARGMRGRTYTVGILLVEMENPFLPGVVAGVKRVLARANYHALIGVSDARMQLESSLIDSMMDMRMDGLILIAPRLHGDLLARFAERIPMVVIGHHEPTARSFDTVNSDDRRGAGIVVEALAAAGHRDIHMLNLPARDDAGTSVYGQREAGYLDAMRTAGLAASGRVVRARERLGEAEADLSRVLAAEALPSAIFCWSDIHAIPLINLARPMGLDVPGRLAIVGYDNSPVAALPLIGLSSVDQNAGTLGETAGEQLLSRIEGRSEAEHMLLEPALVRRASF